MTNYWIIVDEKQKGPFTLEELKAMALPARTPVWREGLADWTRAYNVDELAPWTLNEETVQEQDVTPQSAENKANEPTGNTTGAAQVILIPENELPAGYAAIITDAKPKCPRNYLVLSIVSTLLFFIPFGICAIFCSAKVEPHYQAGRYDKAYKMSERAQLFIVLSIVCMLIWLPFQVVVSLL